MKNITIREINDLIWSGSEYDTSGPVDHDVMRERLLDLLAAEKDITTMESDISKAAKAMNKLLSYGK